MFYITAYRICWVGRAEDLRPFYPQNRYCRLCLSKRSQPVSEKTAFRGVTHKQWQLTLRCLTLWCSLQSWHVLGAAPEPSWFLFQHCEANQAGFSLSWSTRQELPVQARWDEPAWGQENQEASLHEPGSVDFCVCAGLEGVKAILL